MENSICRAVIFHQSQHSSPYFAVDFEVTAAETKASDQGPQCDSIDSAGLKSRGFETCLRHVCLCVSSFRPSISSNAAGKSSDGLSRCR